jgi:hypothetical protein
MAQNFQQFTPGELSELKAALRVRIVILEKRVADYGESFDKANLRDCENALRKVEQGS